MRKLALLIISIVLITSFLIVSRADLFSEFIRAKSYQQGGEYGGKQEIKESSSYQSQEMLTPELDNFREECQRTSAANTICRFKPYEGKIYTHQCCTKPCIQHPQQDKYASYDTICPDGALMKIKYITFQNSVVRLKSNAPDGPEFNLFVETCKKIPGAKACGYKTKGNPYTIECCKSDRCQGINNGEGGWYNKCEESKLIKVSYSL